MPKGWLMALGAVLLLSSAAEGNEILIDLTNQVWRFDQTGADLTGTGWQLPDYDDIAWEYGRGVFAYERSSSITLSNHVYPYTNTVLTLGPVAYYFRTHFTFSGNPDQVVLTLSNLVDDGYIAYLNGVEVSVFNMNAERTLARSAVLQEGVHIVEDLCPGAGALRVGDNVLAVAVYQNVLTSSDVVWGPVLHASPVIIPRILSPTDTVSMAILEGSSTNLRVSVAASPCAQYQWFYEHQEILGATQATYTIPDMSFSYAGSYYATVSDTLGSARSADFVVSLVEIDDWPYVLRATSDARDLGLVTVTFSREVTNALDPFFYSLYTWNTQERIAVTNAAYSKSRDVVLLSLERARQPFTGYALEISSHTIQDRFGNALGDPTFTGLTIPAVFQNGTEDYSGTHDTDLEQQRPDTVWGTDSIVTCDGSPLSQGLLRFDGIFTSGSAYLSPGAAILKATLHIYTVDQSSPQTPIRMARMLAPWDEALSTWNSLGNGIDQTNGVETGTTDALVFAGERNVWVEMDVTAAVQAWANGEANYGWAFLPGSSDGWMWASSEFADVSRRPVLVVEAGHPPPNCEIVEQPQSLTVAEGQPFTLQVISRGTDLHYQWYKDGVAVVGANESTYSVNRAHPANQGNYYVRVTNGIPSECVSDIAVVTVCCPPPPPQLVSAIGNPDQTTISLRFDNTLDAASAQNVSNYSISGGLSITNAVYFSRAVTLTTDGAREVGRNYMLTIANVRDDAAAANLIYPNPTIATLAQDVRLLSFDAAWRYHNEGLDLGTDWRRPNYDDASWPVGPALLGYETGEPTLAALSNQNLFVRTMLLRTDRSQQLITTDYFRTLMNVPFYPDGVTYRIRHVVDDGAVFYLNGVEVARYNMPTGEIKFDTTAPMAVEGMVRSTTNLVGLVCGLNSLAVEVHQQTPLSADVLFGAELIARVPEFLGASCDHGFGIVLNSDGTVTLSWTSPTAILQSSDLATEWQNETNAMSPWRVRPEGRARFYRLR